MIKPIAFSKDEAADVSRRLQRYFTDELDVDLGALPAEMLVEFLAREIGPFFYNRGLRDARDVVAAKAEDIADTLYGLERDGPKR